MSARRVALYLGPALLLVAAAVAAAWPVLAEALSASQKLEKVMPSARRNARVPVELAHKLASIQHGIVRGDSVAFERQRALAEDVGRRLSALQPETWTEPRNREALIKLVLSGIDPTVLGRLVVSDGIPREERPLAEGALAFAMGDRDAAADLLRELDHMRLSASLAGLVALVKAALAAGNDPLEALRLCLEARMLSPGTHVEEAALRLATELAIKLGDVARFETSAVSYLLRFPDSIYSRSIVPRLARVIGSIDFIGNDRGWRLLGAVDARLSVEQQSSLYLEIAEGALRSGKLTSAVRAGQKAVTAAPAGSVPATRAHAVIGAARIAAGELAEGLRELTAGEAVSAGSDLGTLIDAARGIADLVSAAPDPLVAVSPGRAEAAGTRTGAASAEPPPAAKLGGRLSGIVNTARAKLAEADKLLLGGVR